MTNTNCFITIFHYFATINARNNKVMSVCVVFVKLPPRQKIFIYVVCFHIIFRRKKQFFSCCKYVYDFMGIRLHSSLCTRSLLPSCTRIIVEMICKYAINL